MSFGSADHLCLIDGSGFIFRAYHALPPLTRPSDGMPVGAVSGFCNMLYKYVQSANASPSDTPTHIAIIFDHSGETFRNALYPSYKANRPPPPDDLIPQFPITRDAARAFGFAALERKGYEADDLIATLTQKARALGGRVTIVSSDKDLMQLVDDAVLMLDPMKNRTIGPEEVVKKFGLPPKNVIDIQALAGDSTDNIPGAPGIGIKTAAQLIGEYGTLEALLANAAHIKQPKRRAVLQEYAEQIRISKQLVTLATDVPMEINWASLRRSPPDAEQLLSFLHKMEFRTLTRRISEHYAVPPATLDASTASPLTSANAPTDATSDATRALCDFSNPQYTALTQVEDLDALIARIYTIGHVAIDTETTGLDDMRADLVGISLCCEAGIAYYIPP